jgi:calcium-dependent protein kinase
VAPEVLTQKNYDEKCDIWSCAVLMYLMIAGCPPFFGENRKEIAQKIKEGKVEFTGTFKNHT